jgi:hypothetical protein
MKGKRHRIKLNSKNLHEILQKCKNLGVDPKDAKIEASIMEDIRMPDELWTDLYLTFKK